MPESAPSLKTVLRDAAREAQAPATKEDEIASDPVAWVKECRPRIDSKEYGLVPFRPWPHQERIMRLRSSGQSFVVEKSRQTGVTTAVMVADAHSLLYAPVLHSHVIAQQELAAQHVLLEIAKVALQTAKLTPEQEQTLAITGRAIQYRTGDKHNYIRCHSAGPNTARSFPGNRILLEEVAYMDYGEQIWKATMPMLDDGRGGVAVVSTYNGDGDFFCEIVDNAEVLGLEPLAIDWRARPDRDDNWKAESQRRWEGRLEEWAEEHELHRITVGEAVMDIPLIRQLAGEYAKSVVSGHPIAGHEYLKGVDVAGMGRARTVCTAIDKSTTPPQVAYQESHKSKPFDEKVADIAHFDAMFPGDIWIDGAGPGEAVVEVYDPRPKVIRIVGGSAQHAVKRDKRTRITWHMEPRDRLLSQAARKFETASVILPERFRVPRMALKSARWGQKKGRLIDELDSLLLAVYDLPEIRRGKKGRTSPIRGLPATDTLQRILRLRS